MIATRCFLTWLGEKKNPMQSLEAMSEAEVESLFLHPVYGRTD